MHSSRDAGVMASDIQHADVLVHDQGCMELGQLLQILPVCCPDAGLAP
jgi:hypothetical protein